MENESGQSLVIIKSRGKILEGKGKILEANPENILDGKDDKASKGKILVEKGRKKVVGK